MKYAFILPELKRCGPNNVIKNIINSNAFSAFDIFLICIRSGSDNDYIEEFRKNKNVKIFQLCEGGNFTKLMNFKKILREIHPDVLHSHGFYPDFYVSMVKGDFKKITTIHNIIFQDYSYRYGKKGYLFAFFHYFLLKVTDFYKVFGCSSEVSSSLDRVIRLSNLGYVNNGVDIKYFCNLGYDEKKDLKRKLNLDCQVLIAFCGGVERVKRVPELVNDYICKIDNLDFKFIIIGSGPELNEIEESKYIKKIGFVSNPSRYLAAADIVVSNSSSEGYPMAILESLASGCKVFLSDIPSHNHIVNSFPSCAFNIDKLNRSFILSILDNRLDDSQLYNISSDKMANNYLREIFSS